MDNAWNLCFILGFDLSKRRDVDRLLYILENGAISDPDEESDDVIIQAVPEKIVRVGSDIVHPNETTVVADHFEEEEEPRAESSKKWSKPQHDLIWRKHLQFESQQFTWSAPSPSEMIHHLHRLNIFQNT